MATNILITSVGRRAYIVNYFKEALAGSGMVHACNSAHSLGTQAADAYFIAPGIYTDDYIDSIISYCQENQIACVLSLFDIDLLVLAKNEQRFQDAGIELILAPAQFVEKCNDKYQTMQLAHRLGIKAPKTYESRQETLKAIKAGELSYPVLMKPRWGMASLSIYIAHDADELKVFERAARREIQDSYLKFETAFTPDNPLVFQEVLVGKEYGIDIIHDLDGEYQASYVKQKVAMRSGETDIGLTVNSAPFMDAIKAISAQSEHRGILSVDTFLVDGEVYLLEMNCRISGHYPISHVAGVDFPRMLVSWLNGEAAPNECFAFQEGMYVTKDLVPLELKQF